MGKKILNKDEIKDSIDIVSIISSYLTLQKKGRNYLGLCPFHNEKTPSFSVSPERQYFYCFGCQASGDAIKFIEMKEGLEFSDAITFLADRSGIKVIYDESENISDKTDQRTKLTDINRNAMLFYQNCLWKTSEGRACLKYLVDRGLSKETILRFSLGYSPDRWDALLNFMLKRGFRPEDMEEAGLVIHNTQRGSWYDRFRKRLIIPIQGSQNRVIAFGARVLNNELPKYINSPETDLFHKSKTLYAMNFARPDIKKNGSVIIVEGYMDVIKMHQAGLTNCVASLGTAFTRDHARLLKFCAENVFIAYDGDAAGQNATLKGIKILEEENLNVQILEMPDGIDPDDFLGKYGADEFHKLMSNSKKIIDYRLGRIFKNSDRSVSGRKKIRDESFKILSGINDNMEQDHYMSYLADKLDVREYVLRNEFQKFMKRNGENKESSNRNNSIAFDINSESDDEKPFSALKTEEELLRYFIYNTLTFDMFNEIEGYITLSEHLTILQEILSLWSGAGKIDKDELIARIDDKNTKNLLFKVIFAGDSELIGELEYKELLDKIKTNSIDAKVNRLKKKMNSIEDKHESEIILKDIQSLQREKMSLINDR